MTTTIADAVYFPPPLASRDSLPPGEFASQMRRNVLAAFSARAFEDEVLSRSLFGHVQLTLNSPEAIRHVLIDNAENYGRTVATVRLLYPIVGGGLFLAEGEDWKIQRRTVAPSFAPRTLPMLAHHVGAVADQLVAILAAEPDEVDLLEHMHRLAIEVAGRAMFSLDMGEFAPRMRAMLREYGERLAQPSVIEIMLPSWLPAPRDFARWRFRHRWLGLIEEIITARQEKTAPLHPEQGAASDLLDLMATDPVSGRAASRRRLADQVATMIAAGHATTAKRLGYGPDKRMSIKVTTRDVPPYRDPAVILIDQLKEIYIEGELETIDTAQWYPKVQRKDYTVALNLTGTLTDDPDAMLVENYACGGVGNYNGYCNPEIDRLIEQQSMEADQEKRKRLFWEIERRLTEDDAKPLLYFGRGGNCWDPKLKGLTIMVNSIYNGWRMEDVWLDK